MGQRAAGAAESDTDSAGIAVPRMAFKLGELRAGLVNTAVGVDIEMVVVVKLAVTPAVSADRSARCGCVPGRQVRRAWLLSAAVLMMFAW